MASWAERQGEAIVLSEKKLGGHIVVSAQNTDYKLTRWVQIGLERSDNIGADRGLPLRVVLQPGEARDLMTLSTMDPNRGASYSMVSFQGFGNPDAMVDMSVPWLFP